jgi:acetylglutamate kinase
MLLTDVTGVLDADGELQSRLSIEAVRKLIDEGTIRDGMIPKVQCCMDAMASGVARTHIVDGRILHAILLEIFSDDAGVGSLLVP